MPIGGTTTAGRETVPREDAKPTGFNGSYTGRGSLLTPEMHKALVEGISRGNYITTVCESLGIAVPTFYGWKRKGRPVQQIDPETGEEEWVYPDNRYGRLVQDLKQAEAKAEISAVEAIQNHFDSDWRAPAEFLSRRFPERWNPKVQVEMSGKVEHILTATEAQQALYAKLDLLSIEQDDDLEAIEAEIVED